MDLYTGYHSRTPDSAHRNFQKATVHVCCSGKYIFSLLLKIKAQLFSSGSHLAAVAEQSVIRKGQEGGPD